MTFKEKLVILRKSKNLTQDEFASAVGVTRQAVYKWESGQSYPEVPKLLEMKQLFSITIDELLDDNHDIPVPEKKKRKRAPKAVTPKAEPVVKATPVAQSAPAPKAEPVAAPVAQPTPAPKKKEPVEENPVEAEISGEDKICPKCNTVQRLQRKVCWNCGQKFSN